MKLLLSRGADVLAKDKGGLIPLHNACSYGHLEVCSLLLGAGAVLAQVHAADLWQYTPLHEAASKARADVCSLLLAHGADPNRDNYHGKAALQLVPTAQLRQRLTFEYHGVWVFVCISTILFEFFPRICFYLCTVCVTVAEVCAPDSDVYTTIP